MYSSERLSDLDELILGCRTDKSKEYISEAVACYRAGAYRAVIVNAWIAIVYDLIDKMRELAALGDGTASAVIQEFERHHKQIDEGNDQAIKAALEFERNILQISKERMDFFDQQQLIDLARLREDRHRCAHPSFHRIDEPYRPSAEQARMHLRNAISHVLSQRPIQGRAAIDNIVSLVSSSYFPTDPEKALVQLESSEFANPKVSLVRNLIDRLMFGFFDDESSLKYSRKTIAAIKAVLMMQRVTAEERVVRQINRIFCDVPDGKLVHAVGLALEIPEAACSLDQAAIDKSLNFIANGPGVSVVSIVRLAMKLEVFQGVCLDRISQLELDELSDGILNFQLGELAIDRAIQIYEGVRSWDYANSVAEKVVLPLVPLMTEEHIRRIIMAPNQHRADLPGSHGFYKFLVMVKDSGIISIELLNEILCENELERYQITEDDSLN